MKHHTSRTRTQDLKHESKERTSYARAKEEPPI